MSFSTCLLLCGGTMRPLMRYAPTRLSLWRAGAATAALTPRECRGASSTASSQHDGMHSKGSVTQRSAGVDELKAPCKAELGAEALPSFARLLVRVAEGAKGLLGRIAPAPSPQTLPHVLVKHPNFSTLARVSYLPGASVKDLTKAIIAELELGLNFSDLRLFLPPEGSPQKPLSALEPLESQGVTTGCVVHVQRAVTELALKWRTPKDKIYAESVERFYTAAQFAQFAARRNVEHVLPDGAGGRARAISDLDDAKDALAEGGFLLVSDSAVLLVDDVSNLKAYRENTSHGFADESNRAVAQCQTLHDKFGDLKLLGGLRGVVFTKINAKGKPMDDHMQCDGLFKTASGTLLLNEAKTHFTASDARKLGRDILGKMQTVLSSNAGFTSKPPEVMGLIAGLMKVVPLASTPSFEPAAAEECSKLGIYMMQRDGSGFQCTPPGESMGGLQLAGGKAKGC